MHDRHQSILIVEDCSLSSKLAMELFDSEGFSVRIAASGHEALAELARELTDVALVDLQLPDMHGFDLGRRIRMDPRTGDLLALATSADPDVDEAQLREAGFDGFLPKPIEIGDFRARLGGHRRPAAGGPARSIGVAERLEHAIERLGMTASDPWLDGFLARCEGDLGALRRAAAAGDIETTRWIAHRLAGASGMIGGTRLARACLDVERAAGSPGASLDRLEEEMEALRAAILAFARGGARARGQEGVVR